jgi:hypothetical protein
MGKEEGREVGLSRPANQQMLSQWSDPQTIIAAVNLTVVIIYTGVTTAIWRATSRATKATWQALEAGQRPYLGISKCSFEIPGHTKGELRIAVQIENVAAVPARRVELDFEVKFPNGQEKLTASGSDRAQLALFPGQSTSVSIGVPEKHELSVNSSGGAVQVWVVVSYQGVTDRQYKSYATYAFQGFATGFLLLTGDFD